jgi:serine phosphatase RsbU (regulator of sigma subunit)
MLLDVRDSLFGKEKTKAIADAQIQYETEKKQLLIDKLNKENELKQVRLEKFLEEQKRQRTIIFFAVVIIIIVTVSLFIMSRLYVKIKEAHNIVSNQKSELEVKNNQLNLAYEEIKVQKEEIMLQRDIVTAQKEHIEAIHKSLKESIEYAKYIQKAVIRPLSNTIDAFVPDKFEYGLLFKPRDIVSGDFYWAIYLGNHLIIAVADCTGHGVPGALMSMLGLSLLNEIVRKKEITKTSQVLEQLRIEIIYALQQKGIRGEQKDGMDIGIIAIDCDTLDLQFSGANNNLIYLPHSSDEIIEIKGDKMPVAIYEKMDPYTNHTLKVQPNDILYLSTDGYKDQFGGKEQKKFLQKRFNALVCEMRHLPMKEQTSRLETTLNQWMNGEDYSNKQVDDITVLGIRVR